MKFLPQKLKIQVHAYKHNGTLYKVWEHVFVLKHDEKELVLVNKEAFVTKKNGKHWRTRHLAFWIFPNKRWSNFIIMQKKTGIEYYVNIASPIVIEDNTVKYIDYDLDFKVYNNGAYNILDLKEFHYNRQLYEYSENLIKKIWEEFDFTETQIRKNKHVFKNSEIKKYWNIYKSIEKDLK